MQNKNYCSYIYEHMKMNENDIYMKQYMKINALTYIIRYLQCLLIKYY